MGESPLNLACHVDWLQWGWGHSLIGSGWGHSLIGSGSRRRYFLSGQYHWVRMSEKCLWVSYGIGNISRSGPRDYCNAIPSWYDKFYGTIFDNNHNTLHHVTSHREAHKGHMEIWMHFRDQGLFQCLPRVEVVQLKCSYLSPNGQAWKPRPVIAGFRDFKCKQDILFSSSCLKGSPFAIPAEIRTARGKLWDDFKNAKSQNLRARIVYPAKLVVDGRVVRDMFPEWGRWAMVGYEENRDRDTVRIPRSGTPIDIPVGDLIGTRPTQRPQDQAQHPFETPPIVPSQIAYQHPASASSQPPPAVSDPPPLPRHPPPLPFIPPPLPLIPPPLPRHPPPLSRHPPPLPRHPPPAPRHPQPTVANPVSGLAATPGQFPLTPVTMPDRVTNGDTPPGPADATSVPVPVHHPRVDDNNASGRESAPEPPPRRHRGGNGAPNTSPQPMYNGNAVSHSTSGQTSGHPNDGTTVRQSEQVTNELPNIVGNALSTVYEE